MKPIDCINKAISIIEELCKKDDLGNIEHNKLDETITDVYDVLLEGRGLCE